MQRKERVLEGMVFLKPENEKITSLKIAWILLTYRRWEEKMTSVNGDIPYEPFSAVYEPSNAF